jgi:hypothetical protein
MTPIFSDGTNCKIEVRILIYNPNFSQPIDFPSKFIGGTITSTRSINIGSSSLSIPIKEHYSYEVTVGGKKEQISYNQIFTVYSVVHLLVSRNDSPFRKLNSGVITSRSINFTPDKFSFTLTVKSLESFIQENEIFFDLNSVNESGQVRSEENIEGSISGMANMLQSSKSIRDTMYVLWDELLCKFLLGKVLGGAKRFGGLPIIAESESEDKSLLKFNVTPKSYTSNFIHIIQFMSSINIGQTINLMDIIKSYSSAPLYELFIDSLESVGGDEDSPDNSGVLSYDIESGKNGDNYSVESNECKLIFRQTPYGYFDKDGIWDISVDPFYSVKINEIKKISSTESIEDYKSGVHVSLSVYESASLIINYPKYSSTLIKIFGKKLLNIKLAGLSGKKDPDRKDKENLVKDLDKIRDRMFAIFCNPDNLKTLRLNIDLPFNFVRQGVALYVDYEEQTLSYLEETMNAVLGFFGYIESVTDTFEPSGKANTQLQLKWAVDPLNQYSEDKEQSSIPSSPASK